MKWRDRHAFADEIGVTPDTVRGWIDRHWTKGVHYIVVGKTTLVDRKEVARWLESQKVSKNAQAPCASISDGRARGSRRLIQGPETPRTCAA
jgi:hypothetical protein